MTTIPPTHGRQQYERITVVVPPTVQVQLVAPPSPVAAPARVRLSRRQWASIVLGAAVLVLGVRLVTTSLPGCASADPAADPKVSLPMARQAVADVSADLPARAKSVDADADMVMQRTPIQVQPAMVPVVTDLHVQAAGVAADGKRLAPVVPQLATATVAVAKVEQQNVDLKAEQKSSLTKLLPWIVVGGVLGLAGAALLFVLDKPKSAACVAAVSVVGIVASIVVGQFAALIGGTAIVVVVLIVVGVLAYEVYVHKNTIVPQMEHVIQMFHQLSPKAVVEQIAGVGAVPGKAAVVQDDATVAARKRALASGAVPVAAPPALPTSPTVGG